MFGNKNLVILKTDNRFSKGFKSFGITRTCKVYLNVPISRTKLRCKTVVLIKDIYYLFVEKSTQLFIAVRIPFTNGI